ncbi:ribonuclease H-like domain-containing protein [Myxozyma melibiosi]|uniref:Ribonuclease H-like domain-containing protein n=1 Tax=Myxozyma melibiosi TaxID=54550 RepID=A0ABR1FC84_9ASCO
MSSPGSSSSSPSRSSNSTAPSDVASPASSEISDLLGNLSIKDNAASELTRPLNDYTIRYLFCLDIEATCSEYLPFLEDTHEVIELPVVLVDTHKCEIIDEFHTFVKPRYARILTAHCTELTGITQAQVDSAPTFPQAIDMLNRFMLSHADILSPHPKDTSASQRAYRNYAWVTDGNADIDRFLCLRSCKINRVLLPPYLQGQYINLKQLYKDHFRERGHKRMAEMLHTWNAEFEGRLHSGLDDARQVARIMIFLMKREHVDLRTNRSIVMQSNYRFTYRNLSPRW